MKENMNTTNNTPPQCQSINRSALNTLSDIQNAHEIDYYFREIMITQRCDKFVNLSSPRTAVVNELGVNGLDNDENLKLSQVQIV